MLFECNRVNRLWAELQIWLSTKMNKAPVFNVHSVILGNRDNETIINYVTLITKHEIYKSKWNKSNISIIQLKNVLKHHMNLDIYIYWYNKKLPKTLGKWSALYNALRTLT